MKVFQKMLAVVGAIAILFLVLRGIGTMQQNSKGNIDKQARSACGINVAIRGGYALKGETEVTLHSDTVKQRPQYKLAGGNIKGRSVHCLVTWDRDQRKTIDTMVRWDSTGRSVDL